MTREEAIETLKTENCYECSYGCGETINCPAEDCPLPEAVKMAIQALEQKPCEDAISRQAVIKCLERGDTLSSIDHRLIDQIKRLPSVNPQPKTGHCVWCSSPYRIEYYWIDRDGNTASYQDEDRHIVATGIANYCPNCGAKMVEPQERSDKE